MQLQRNDVRTILARGRAADWTRLLPPGWVFVALSVLVAVAAFYWFAVGSGSAETQYLTETVSRGDVTVTVRATGTIEPTDEVDISSELSGTMRSVDVDYNDRVQKGQVLAQLDTESLEAQIARARATLALKQGKVSEIEATVGETKATHNRAVVLFRQQALSRQELESARATYDRATASLTSAKADVATARADLKVYETNLGKAKIRSPINGIVLDRNVEPGQTVASSLQAPVLFKLAEDLKRMQLEVDIDEADVGKVNTGNGAIFWVEAFQDRTFPAKISEVRYSPETVDGVVTYKAVLTIDNSELLLRPGMTATTDIKVEELKNAVLVPNAALRFTPPVETGTKTNRSWLRSLMPGPPRRSAQSAAPAGTGKSVWVLVGGQPVERPIKTGATDGIHTAVVSGELAPGDKIIVDTETSG